MGHNSSTLLWTLPLGCGQKRLRMWPSLNIYIRFIVILWWSVLFLSEESLVLGTIILLMISRSTGEARTFWSLSIARTILAP
jgi:hypothetical protein